MKNLPIKSPSFQYVEQSFREWLDILGYAPSTIESLPIHIREMFYWLESQNQNEHQKESSITEINQISTELIRTYYAQLRNRSNQRRGGGLSKNALNKHVQALYKFTEYLRQSGRLILPHLKIKWEKEDIKQTHWLSQEEIKTLYRASYGENAGTKLEPINARDRAMLTIFYGCGLRRNEGYHLDVSDINFDRSILQVRKGKGYKERLVPFNKTSSQYLQSYIYDARPRLLKEINDRNQGKEEALFISQRGSRMQGQSLALRLKVLQDRSDGLELRQKDISLHTLRHSIATHLLEQGMSLEKIARFLGHSSLESTQIYTHLLDPKLDSEERSEERRLRHQPFNNIKPYESTQLHEDEY